MIPTPVWFALSLQENQDLRYSIRGYAKHRGVSEAAVRKAIKTGRIDKGEDGKIDPEIANEQWAANTDFSRTRGKSTSKRASGAKKTTGTGSVDTEMLSNDKAYQRAKIANEVLKAQIGKIELRILKGELIDKEKACKKVFELSRRERDHWINWPARVSAQFAAVLKLDEHFVYTVLQEEVRKELFRQAGRYRKVNDDTR